MVTSNTATGYVAKISMLRLNIGSGKLSSCMLSIGPGPKAVQGKGGAAIGSNYNRKGQITTGRVKLQPGKPKQGQITTGDIEIL